MSTQQEKPHLPGYIVLGRKKGSNAYQGVVEHSFTMGLSEDHVRFWWTFDKATMNILPGTIDVDGFKDACLSCSEFAKNHPDMEFEVFDAHSDDLPVIIDWDQWREDEQPAKTFSGVKNKFGARNPRFEMR